MPVSVKDLSCLMLGLQRQEIEGRASDWANFYMQATTAQRPANFCGNSIQFVPLNFHRLFFFIPSIHYTMYVTIHIGCDFFYVYLGKKKLRT